MYPVSELFKSKIKELDRTFEAKIQIQHSLGVLNLTDADIVGGSLIYNESSQAGEDFTIGGVVASDLTVTILNKPEYADYDFVGATVTANIGLEVGTGFEYVPLGVFNIDEVGKQRNTIKIKAIDNMIKLDKPYSLSSLGYPATLFQIYADICNVCDVMIGTIDFPNKDYVVQEKPVGDNTFRDILGYVAELSGAFARMNRHGALELTWYKPTGLILAPTNRFNFKPRDDKIRITGVMATVDDTTYLAGTDEYAIDLTENPLLQGDYETVLPNIYNNIKDTEFTPFESNWQGNPAIQAGDMITQIDRDGKVYPSLVTSSTYKYRGSSTLKAEGLPMVAKGYKGSTNKRISNIVRKEIKPIGDQLTTLEQAQLHATQLIANMLGGYAIQGPDAFYVADNPDLQQAVKVWKFGLGGFGYSENGVDGPYETAITADGSIVAMLVSAGIVTADMIQTGELRSVDGTTRISLDNSALQIFDPENAEKIRMGKVENNIYGMKANHADGSYTQLTEEGLKRFVPVPIYTEIPTGISNFEGFEGGELPEGWEGSGIVIDTDKRSGNYCCHINISVSVLDITIYYQVVTTEYITKDCQMSFWYKALVDGTLFIDGVAHNLPASSSWTEYTINVTKGYHVFMWRSGLGHSDLEYGIRLDDITFEENPVMYEIAEYATEGYDYGFRTYIGQAATTGRYSGVGYEGLISDIWIQLPDDFKGKNFEIFLSFKSIDSTSDYMTAVQKITLEVLEIDYERAAFKVRARLRGVATWYEAYASSWDWQTGYVTGVGTRNGGWYSVAGFNFIYMATY